MIECCNGVCVWNDVLLSVDLDVLRSGVIDVVHFGVF